MAITPYLADNLAPRPNARNTESMKRAFARLAATAWTPLGGYPGSDVRWPVRCELCGTTVAVFYSHMRRDRVRHRGCLPVAQRPAAIAAWVTQQKNQADTPA
ncbi:hypothetical protein [Streptomyces sp. Ac-502]|uniref:hypothetical protein n=1 Tax=Streptomyces sp. Ac-502 TaxID=3342801 RepID=UPI003862B624